MAKMLPPHDRRPSPAPMASRQQMNGNGGKAGGGTHRADMTQPICPTPVQKAIKRS